MARKSQAQFSVEETWRSIMMTGDPPPSVRGPWYMSRRWKLVARRLPAAPRCRMCYYPFHGPGGSLARHLFDIRPSRMNPRICNRCEMFAEEFPGGAEVEMSLLFADVRGSTTLAESMSPAEFGRLINRFYDVSTQAVIEENGFIEKLIGDEVTGFFVPGFAGPEHTHSAVRSARTILDATRSWIPVGVGVHTGRAFIGSVHSQAGVTEIAILGDAVNVAARLASQAGPGQILITDTARQAAGLEVDGLEARRLQLKGRSEPVDVWVWQGDAAP